MSERMQHATVSTGAGQDVGKNQSLVMGARAGVLLFCPAGNRIAEPCENCRHREIFVEAAGNARCRQDATGGRPACFSRLVCGINSIPRRARTSFRHGPALRPDGRCTKKRLETGAFRALLRRFVRISRPFLCASLPPCPCIGTAGSGRRVVVGRHVAARLAAGAASCPVSNLDTILLEDNAAGRHCSRR